MLHTVFDREEQRTSFTVASVLIIVLYTYTQLLKFPPKFIKLLEEGGGQKVIENI